MPHAGIPLTLLTQTPVCLGAVLVSDFFDDLVVLSDEVLHAQALTLLDMAHPTSRHRIRPWFRALLERSIAARTMRLPGKLSVSSLERRRRAVASLYEDCRRMQRRLQHLAVA